MEAMEISKINGHVAELYVKGGVAYVNGHVNDLHMSGGVVYNYGHVDDFHQTGGVYQDNGKHAPQVRIVYKDHVVEKKVEVVKWKYRDRIVYKDNEETAHLRDLLDAAMEVNRRQAERIRQLERIISEHREAEMPDPWNVKPTKADCEKLLRQFDLFTTNI